MIKDIDQTDLHRSEPSSRTDLRDEHSHHKLATDFGDDKPTSRCIFLDNVSFRIAEIKPVIRRVAWCW